ncbi:MAG: hypothetical protein B9S38_02445 [Verrucomicrobiia bacterium Tous-C4TDCM]|nr:MAG: hypothetical protein B9S38_02445 [Verrucomicrobiae bacterium Tous-C4TDCM]
MKLIDFQGIPNTDAAHQSGVVSSTALTLLSLLAAGALHPNTKFVRFCVDDADLRYTVQGTPPTTSLGRRVAYDSAVVLSREEADLCQLIRATATNAVVQIMQYKQ